MGLKVNQVCKQTQKAGWPYELRKKMKGWSHSEGSIISILWYVKAKMVGHMPEMRPGGGRRPRSEQWHSGETGEPEQGERMGTLRRGGRVFLCEGKKRNKDAVKRRCRRVMISRFPSLF